MKVQFGTIITGARGRVGGVVLSANASGAYAKSYNRGVYRYSAKQLTQRAVISSMGALWRGITSTQRGDWNTYAAAGPQALVDSLGNTYYANGYNWFCNCNSNLILAGRSTISAAPTIAVPAAPTIGTLTITAPGTASNSLAVTVASFGSDDAIVELTFVRSEARITYNPRNFLFAVAVQNGSLATPISLGNIQGLYGTVQAGTYWIARCAAQTSEGRRGSYSVSVTVAV